MKFNTKLIDIAGNTKLADVVDAPNENSAIAVLIAKLHNITPKLIGDFDMREIASRSQLTAQVEIIK